MSTMHFQSMPPKENLGQSLLTGDESVILAALKAAKKSSRQKYLSQILLILTNTESSRVRNAAAIALADLHSEKIKDALINLLMRADTKNSRGTLLYVLDEIGASLPIDIATELISTSRYEAREEALGFLKSRRIDWNPEQLQRSMRKLKRMALSKNIERSGAAQRALELAIKLVTPKKSGGDRKATLRSKIKRVA